MKRYDGRTQQVDVLMNRTRALLCALMLGLSCSAATAEQVAVDHGALGLLAEINSPVDDIAGQRVFLVLHGTLAHANMEIIGQLLDALAEYGEPALAPTLSLGVNRRTGMFPCDSIHRHRHEDALEELALWLEWLRDHGAASVVLVGHSRGANQVAQMLARHADEFLSAAVLIAPPNRTVAPGGRSEVRGPAEPEAAGRRDAVDGQDIELLPRFLHCDNARVSAVSRASYLQTPGNSATADVLREVSRPVLVILGSDDRVIPPDRWLGGEAQRSKATGKVDVHVIDGADHFFRDIYADELVEYVLGWLP